MSIKYHSNILFADNNQLRLGTGSDLRIYHNGSNSFIQDSGTGDLRLMSSHLKLMDASENLVLGVQAGAVAVTGTLTVGVDDTGHDVKFFGDTSGKYMLWDASANQLRVEGSIRIDSSSGNAIFKCDTGNLKIQVNEADHDLLLQSDDGSGSIATYIKLDGANVRTAFSKNARFSDSVELELGSDGDGHLKHDGSNMEIYNTTGDLTIKQDQNDGDIIFQSDDGSGGLTTYLQLDGSEGHTIANKEINFPDGVNATFGNATNGDLRIHHTSGESVIHNTVGHFYIGNLADDKDIIFQSDDGSGGSTAYLTLDGSATITQVHKNLRVDDSIQLQLGTGSDLRLYHDGTNSYIHNDTGSLFIENDLNDGSTYLRGDNGSGGLAVYFQVDGASEILQVHKDLYALDGIKLRVGDAGDLYMLHDGSNSYIHHNGTGNLYMKADTGNIQIINYTNDADIVLQSDDGSGGVTPYFTLDGSTGHSVANKEIQFLDSIVARFGTGNDLAIYHNGTSSFIANDNGDLKIQQFADDGDISFQCDNGAGGNTEYFRLDGSLATHDGSANTARYTVWGDNSIVAFGTSRDLVMYHTGTSSFISNYTGHFYIDQNLDDGDIVFRCDDGSGGTTEYFKLDGSDPSLVVSKKMLLGDNVSFYVGSNIDLELNHDGSDTYITARNTDLKIQQLGDDKDIIFYCDDGSGGVEEYFRLDGSISSGNPFTVFPDNSHLAFGNSQDLQIDHDGNHSVIYNKTGHLYISNDSNDGDIVLRSDDGSGGVTAYITLDGGLGYTTVQKNMRFEDSVQLQIGTGGDAGFLHDGSNAVLFNSTGHFYIRNDADDSDVVLQSDDGSGGRTAYLTLDGGLGYTTVQKHIRFDDTVKAVFGAGTDLQINHTGTDSWIENKVGDLYIRQEADDKDIIFKCDDGSGGDTAYLTLDGSATTAVFEVDTYLNSSGNYIYSDISDNSFKFADNATLKIGTGNDLHLKHNGTDSQVTNYAGNLQFTNLADDKDISFASDNGAGGDTIYFFLDGSAAEHDGSATTALYTIWPDNSRVAVGSSADLQLDHNGTDSVIRNATGDLYIQQNADNSRIRFQADDGAGGITSYFDMQGSAATHDGSATTATFTQWYDNSRIALGNGYDVQLWHDSTNTIFYSQTGNLTFQQAADDADIVFQSDDGSGGLATYFKLDGSSASSGTLYTQFPDNSNLTFGSADDLQIKHDGTDSKITNSTGDLVIRNLADDKDVIFQSDDNSGGVTTYLTLDGSSAKVLVNRPSIFYDTIEMASYIYHNGDTNSYFGFSGADTYVLATGGTTALTVNSSQAATFAGDVQAAGLYVGSTNTSFDFYNNGTSYLNGATTIDDNTQINGTLTVGVDDTGHDVIFYGATSGRYLHWDESADALKLKDNVGLYVGSSNDAVFWHNGTDTFIENFSGGNLYIDQEVNDADMVFRCDDGTGGVAEYFRLDGGAAITVVSKEMRFADSVPLKLGSGPDCEFFHDGTDSQIKNATGDLKIEVSADDKDIIFRGDDQSGGVTTYFRVDGSTGYVKFEDNRRIAVGSGEDTHIYHDGSNSYITHGGTGHLKIRQSTDDSDIIFECDDGSGGTTAYLTLDGSDTAIKIGKELQINGDSRKLKLGASGDLEMFHNGTDSSINNATGHLYIKNEADDKDIIFQSDDGSGGVATYMTIDGSTNRVNFNKAIKVADSIDLNLGAGLDLRLQHNGTDSFITNHNGDLKIINYADDKDIVFQSDDNSGGVTEYFRLDGSALRSVFLRDFLLADSVKGRFGSGGDLEILHNGTNSFIQNNTGDLFIQNLQDDGDIEFKSDDGSGGIQTYLTIDGGADRTIFSRSSRHNDGVVAAFGASEDLQIYHDGSNSYIAEGGTGDLVLNTNGASIKLLFNGSEFMGQFVANGSARLYYDNNKKLETVSAGVKTTYSPTSNTDGDVAGDIVHLGETTTVAGKIYYYKSDGEWGLVDADAASTCSGLLAVALGTSSSTNGMLLRGMATIANDPGAVGDTLFASTTAGEATATAPSGSGDIVRVIGYCLNATNGQIWFNPDGAFVEVA